MVIDEFNFANFHAKAFGVKAKLYIATGKALANHMGAMEWADLQAFADTQDTSIALISFLNHAYLVATPDHYYREGVDFAAIEEQIKETELIASAGTYIEDSGYSLETAWPADQFRRMGLIQEDNKWNGVFRSI